MAHTIGGVTVNPPISGDIHYVRQNRWSEAAPLGYTGNINTLIGAGPLMARLRYWMTAAEMASIKTLADAGASVAWVYTDGDMGITSRTVLIKVFDAKKNSAVKGAARWDCDLVMEEVV